MVINLSSGWFKLGLAGLGVFITGLVIFAAIGQTSTPVPSQNIQPQLEVTAAKPDNKAVAQPEIQNNVSPNTRISEWNALEFQNGLTVTDCLQCDEDVAVMITCSTNSGTLAAQIPWLAFDSATPGSRAKVTLTIDNLAYVRLATLKNMPLVGHVPEILLYTDDPVLEQLASGTELSFFMLSEQRTTSNGPIPLTGSRKAMTKITDVCGTPQRRGRN